MAVWTYKELTEHLNQNQLNQDTLLWVDFYTERDISLIAKDFEMCSNEEVDKYFTKEVLKEVLQEIDNFNYNEHAESVRDVIGEKLTNVLPNELDEELDQELWKE